MARRIFFFILCFCVFRIFGQEVLTGLQENPVIVRALKENSQNINVKNGSSLVLPFIDDFSGNSPFPSDTLWEDRYVFVNNSYPLFPPSAGVATFDALDDSGQVYSNAQTYAFISDYLTSRPIRLDTSYIGTPAAIKVSDSLYFSFFYQPQGLGDAPDEDDSLVLEFYSSVDTSWNKVWSVGGISLQDFKTLYNAYYKQVIIPITDSALYFKKDFRFRFYNYASIGDDNLPGWSANVDQWNIDYIYLNINRYMGDSLYRDISFAAPAQSMLKKYQSMPWNQYSVDPAGNMEDTLSMVIGNLSDIVYNYQYLYNIQDPSSVLVAQYDGGSYNLNPFYQSGYQNYAPHAKPLVSYTFPAMTQKTDYTITHILNPSAPADIIRQNDTLRFVQRFSNYYAYDDGTPEAGYGLSVANGKAAYKFTLSQQDTLRGVNMFFNRTADNSNWQYFNLMVWSSLSPETILYESPLIKPIFGNELNAFCTYYINEDLVVNGDFYIGFKQSNGNNLNVGYDRNTRGNGFLYYNTDGTWYNTMYQGSLMMRPVLGAPVYYAGIENAKIAENIHLSVYPNPVRDGNLNICLPNEYDINNSTLKIYSYSGSEVYSSALSKSVNICSLNPGVYLLVVINNSDVYSCRFVVSR